MTSLQVPEAQLRALVEAVHEPVKTTIEELASPYYFAVQGVLDAAIALVDAFEHEPAPPVAAVRADQLDALMEAAKDCDEAAAIRVAADNGTSEADPVEAEALFKVCVGILRQRVRTFLAAAPSGADQQEPAMKENDDE